jgi:hypothetical protein
MKTDYANYKIYNGTVIGFDPCTGDYTNNLKKGYVIKIDSVSDSGDVVPIDTATTYNFPDIFGFSPDLFQYYRTNFLFPLPYRDSFKFRFSYSYTSTNQKVSILCTADIYTGGLYSATKGKQIYIYKIY